MNTDIIIELATEKIRIDFGDFSATLFQILLFQKKSNIFELNKTIPMIKYKFLRHTIFKLFNYDIIFVKKKNINKFKKKTIYISFFPNLHGAIVRIRFSRFLSLIEKEYGKNSKYIIKKAFESGNSSLFEVLHRLNLIKSDDLKYKETCVTHLIRDRLFKQVFFYKKTCYFRKNIDSLQKPFCRAKIDFLWKICYLKLTLLVKTILIICTTDDYFCFELKIIIRFYFFKSNENKPHFDLTTFVCLDSLIDYVNEISNNCHKEEIFFLQLIENFCLSYFILIVKKSVFKIKIKLALDYFKKKMIEVIINIRFGKCFFKFFKIISCYLVSDQNELTREFSIEKKTIKKILYQMYRLNFIFLEEKNKHNISVYSNSIVLWKINLNTIVDKFILEFYKTIYNLLLRKEELCNICKYIKRTNGIFLKKCHLFFYLHILDINIFQLDGLLLILEK